MNLNEYAFIDPDEFEEQLGTSLVDQKVYTVIYRPLD
jgi:hypothetical protein